VRAARHPVPACGEGAGGRGELVDAIPDGTSAAWSIPDVRDGLTRRERIVLRILAETQRERGGRGVPMLQLYGRVIEEVDMSKEELMTLVRRLMGRLV
jgi:hypothetical protein